MAKSPSKKVAFGFLEGAFFVQYFMDKLFCNRPCLFGFWLGVYLKNPRRCSILLKSSACCAACRETRHAAQGATAAHGDCLTRLFALVYVRVAVPASCGAPWTALAFCDRCPCFASLHPPQAALWLRSPSKKFYGKSRTRHFVPRTQFAVKFPWWCRRRRACPPTATDFILFRQSEQRLLRCLTLEYTMHKVFQGFAPCIRYLFANFPALWIYQIRPGVVLQRALAGC